MKGSTLHLLVACPLTNHFLVVLSFKVTVLLQMRSLDDLNLLVNALSLLSLNAFLDEVTEPIHRNVAQGAISILLISNKPRHHVFIGI